MIDLDLRGVWLKFMLDLYHPRELMIPFSTKILIFECELCHTLIFNVGAGLMTLLPNQGLDQKTT